MSNFESDIAAFFTENTIKFLLLFKLEYIKHLGNIINTTKSIALNPEKNPVKSVNPESSIKAKKAPSTSLPEQQKPKEEEVKEQIDEIRQSNISRPSEANVSSVIHEKTGDSRQSIAYQPVKTFSKMFLSFKMEKQTKRVKFDVKASFLSLKHSIPALVHLSNNINILPSIALHLPNDKGSHMLDLLNWSMKIAYNE